MLRPPPPHSKNPDYTPLPIREVSFIPPNTRHILVTAAFHQGLFFPIGPIWTRLSPMNQFFDRPDCRPESPPIVPFFDPIESRPMDHGGGWGRITQVRSSRDRHVSGAQVCESTRKYPQVPGKDPVETRGPSGDPRTTKTTTGRRFLIGYCFSTCLKTVADHFFGTRPSED